MPLSRSPGLDGTKLCSSGNPFGQCNGIADTRLGTATTIIFDQFIFFQTA